MVVLQKWASRPVIAAVVGTALVSSAVPAQADSGSGTPSPSVEVEEIPVLGTFEFAANGFGEDERFRGAVHGVQRIDGATVLYYSIGTEAGPFAGSSIYWRDQWNLDLYSDEQVADVDLVDPVGLKRYGPLSVPGEVAGSHEGLAVPTQDLADTSAEASKGRRLVVGWAVMPELPAEVKSVDVRLMRDQVVPNVPVGEGALEPVVDETAPFLGEGWPRVSSAEKIAAADPAKVTFDLARNEGDAEGVVESSESVEDVEVTLDANVLFDKSSAELRPEGEAKLDEVAADIADRGTGEVVVTGYTDSVGSNADNQVLSERRAQSVLDVLEPKSGSGVTFEAEGKGEADPVADNETEEGKQQNRRVTVEYAIEGEQ